MYGQCEYIANSVYFIQLLLIVFVLLVLVT